VLAGMRRLRGTPFDLFGHTKERRLERRLIADYRATIRRVIADLRPDNQALAVEIAGLPEAIRGYGHVKRASMAAAKAREEVLVAALSHPAVRTAAE
jgi:indolepyruvate ferredoxin oxidoreductase